MQYGYIVKNVISGVWKLGLSAFRATQYVTGMWDRCSVADGAWCKEFLHFCSYGVTCSGLIHSGFSPPRCHDTSTVWEVRAAADGSVLTGFSGSAFFGIRFMPSGLSEDGCWKQEGPVGRRSLCCG